MGHRFEIYLPREYADKVIEISESFGIHAQIVGRVEKAGKPGKYLTIRSEKGVFEYEAKNGLRVFCLQRQQGRRFLASGFGF